MSRRSPTNDRYVAERSDKPSGGTKKSASSAKLSRPAAASVRMESSKARQTRRQKAMAESTMSKEEKKAARAKERERENTLYTASTILMNKDEKYKRFKRIWWGMLIAAVVLTALSWATLSGQLGNEVLSVIVLVLAYAAIIGALILDLTVIRKRRNFFRDKVNSMTEKQVNRLIENSYTEKAALEAAKQAKKAAKKAGLSAAEQQAAYDKAYAEGMKGIKESAADIVALDSGESAKKMKVSYAKGVAGNKDDSALEEALTEEEKRIAEAKAAEEARLEVARKAARDFAASRRSAKG